MTATHENALPEPEAEISHGETAPEPLNATHHTKTSD